MSLFTVVVMNDTLGPRPRSDDRPGLVDERAKAETFDDLNAALLRFLDVGKSLEKEVEAQKFGLTKFSVSVAVFSPAWTRIAIWEWSNHRGRAR